MRNTFKSASTFQCKDSGPEGSEGSSLPNSMTVQAHRPNQARPASREPVLFRFLRAACHTRHAQPGLT